MRRAEQPLIDKTQRNIRVNGDIRAASVSNKQRIDQEIRLPELQGVFECNKEIHMSRKYIDCRDYPSEMHCSIAISADSDQELVEAAVQHAVTVHKHEDTPEFRKMVQEQIKEGTPPVEHADMAA
jgi:predicted small metal-binding protein